MSVIVTPNDVWPVTKWNIFTCNTCHKSPQASVSLIWILLWPINDRTDALRKWYNWIYFFRNNKQRTDFLLIWTLGCQEHVSVLVSFLLFLFNCCLTVIGVILAARNITAERTQSFHDYKSTQSSTKVIFIDLQRMFEFKKSISNEGLFCGENLEISLQSVTCQLCCQIIRDKDDILSDILSEITLHKISVTSLLCGPWADLWPFYELYCRRFSLYI